MRLFTIGIWTSANDWIILSTRRCRRVTVIRDIQPHQGRLTIEAVFSVITTLPKMSKLDIAGRSIHSHIYSIVSSNSDFKLQSSCHSTSPFAHLSPHITRLWYVALSSLNSLTKSSTSRPVTTAFSESDADPTNADARASERSSCAVVACRRRMSRNWGVNRCR